MSGEHDLLGSGLSREELFELYAHTLEEYRFQVRLNWDRSRYFFVLNLAFLGIGAGLERTGFDLVAAGTFVAGAILAFLSILNTHTQHGYYRSTRETVTRLQERLVLDDLAARPTRGFGGKRWRLASVTSVIYFMLGTIWLLDSLGFFWLVGRAFLS